MKPQPVFSQADVVNRVADQLADDFPDDPLEVIAADLVKDPTPDEDLAMAITVAMELRRRAAAGVRKQPAVAV